MMIFISVVIALLLERITPQYVLLRQFNRLNDYIRWMVDVVHIERAGKWGAIAALFVPLLLLTWLLGGLFENTFFGLFELAFNVAVLFFCLGPKSLDAQVDRYLSAIETGDEDEQFRLAEEFIEHTPSTDLSAQSAEFSKAIFVQANSRIYAVLLWFTLLGPVAAVLYRVLEQMLSQNMLQAPLQRLNETLRILLGWIDWIPARVSLFAFMLSGSFDEGLKAIRNSGVCTSDSYENNHECLRSVGLQTVSAEEVVNDTQAMALVKKSRGLVLRALVVWLLLVLFLTWVS